MESKKSLTLLVTVFAVVFGALAMANPVFAASKEQVLYSFCSVSNCTDGASPFYGSLTFDAAGNLYGTTANGGTNGGGTVFELMPGAGGTWTENVLYNFCSASGCTDGRSPFAGVIFDAAGNLYGTTIYGGSGTGCSGSGCGTAFELSPGTNGTWTETVLYSFCSATNCTDGANPYAGLIFDAAGNLYGATANGGFACGGGGCGTVFELSATGGTWTETVLFHFTGYDGQNPTTDLIFDSSGNLYGTSGGGTECHGGEFGRCGVVFEVFSGGGEKVLHRFGDRGSVKHDGLFPVARLVFDTAGNLYGTTSSGGTHPKVGGGTVFELANGTWTEKILHNFDGKDGAGPAAGLSSTRQGTSTGQRRRAVLIRARFSS